MSFLTSSGLLTDPCAIRSCSPPGGRLNLLGVGFSEEAQNRHSAGSSLAMLCCVAWPSYRSGRPPHKG